MPRILQTLQSRSSLKRRHLLPGMSVGLQKSDSIITVSPDSQLLFGGWGGEKGRTETGLEQIEVETVDSRPTCFFVGTELCQPFSYLSSECDWHVTKDSLASQMITCLRLSGLFIIT